MSQDLITNKFRNFNLTNLNRNIASESTNDIFYLFIGQSNNNPTDNVLNPIESIYSDEVIHRSMVAMKKLGNGDFSEVVERRKWETNIIYDEYSDKSDLSNLDFYVISPTGSVGESGGKVYVCLDNNSGGISSVIPTHDDSSASTTETLSDGYIWRWIYTISLSNKFDEYDGDYMPVINGTNPVDSKVIRAKIISGGSGYGATGVYNCPIVGDATVDGQAVVTILNNSVTDISISNEGQGFTFANIDLSPAYPQANTPPSIPAVIDVILTPPGGFGYDNISLLKSELLMISTDFTEGEGGKFPMISSDDVPFSYGQIGIIKNPIDPEGGVGLLNTAVVKCQTELTVTSLSSEWDPKSGDVIIGLTTGAYGVVSYWESTTNILGITQPSEIGKGLDEDKKLTPFDNSSEKIKIGDESADITGITPPEYVVYSGDILYVMNTPNVPRAVQQKERIKLVLDF